MNITLELTIDEINIILRTLGRLPFDEVVDLIFKIKKQGEEQLPKEEEKVEEVTATEGELV